MTPQKIVLICAGVALLIPWIIELFRIWGLQNQEKKSEPFLCKNLRYLVWVIGQVRAGKTTFLAGYGNVRTKDLIRKAKEKIEFTCRAFPNVPFDCIEDTLKADFDKGLIDSYGEAVKLCSSGSILGKYSNLYYDNHTAPHPVPFVQMLAGYVDARWALLRNNYCYYYSKAFYSRVTHNDAMDYNPSMMAIKNCFANEKVGESNDPKKKEKDFGESNDYHILPYSVIMEDERQISGKDCTRFMAYNKEDSGASDCMRLIGQLGQETIYYITDNQYWGTDINRERDLATEVVLINDSIAVNPRFMEMFLIKVSEIPAKVHLWAKRKRTDANKILSPYLQPSWARTYLSKTSQLKKKIVAKSGYVIYHATIYHNPADFGKKAKSAIYKVDPLRAVYPLLYCYGSIDTYQFHSVQQKLISHSRWRLTDEAKPADPSNLADLVLQKAAKGGKETKTNLKAEGRANST